MTSTEMPTGRPSKPTPAGDFASVATRMACWLWGLMASATGVALLVLLQMNRSRVDGVSQSLLYRVIVQCWIVARQYGEIPVPVLDSDPRLLTLYTNRDFDDAFLVASSAVAFCFTAAAWLTAIGLARGERWAGRSVLVAASTIVAFLAAYAAWYAIQGPSLEGFALIAAAASLPVAAIVAATRAKEPTDDPKSPRRRNSLTRPAILLIIAAHAILIAPALACAWVVAGVIVRRIWLSFAA